MFTRYLVLLYDFGNVASVHTRKPFLERDDRMAEGTLQKLNYNIIGRGEIMNEGIQRYLY
jgi:hypothetical protein